MKTILVTGGAGFIGSHLCEKLLRNGNNVISLDNFNNYYDPIYKINNIEEINRYISENKLINVNFTNIKGDIRDKEILGELFKNYKVDLVVHLAACAGVRYSIKYPQLYNDVNIMGTINILECLKKYKIKKFIFASSSSVYGNSGKKSFCENDKVDKPISPYAATKKAGELICHTYHHLYDINIACLRFFTVYGPRQRPDLAIRKFTEKILNNKEILVYGDGSTERDYTFIDDILDGIERSIDWINSGENKYSIFNLGESRTIKLIDMIHTIEESLNVKAKIKFYNEQPGDLKRTCADISYSKKVLQYNPKIEFKEGIDRFTKWINIEKEVDLIYS